MRILLVYPEFPDTFWSFKPALKFTQTLGLLTVAAMFPAQWEKRLVDLNEEQECGRNYPDHSIMVRCIRKVESTKELPRSLCETK